jgi:hypothetical protein
MINEVRETVLAIANKENFGYITPTDFNRYAVKAQLDIFTQLMYDYNHQVNKQNKRTTILGASVASNDDFADLAKRKLKLIEEFSTSTPLYVASSSISGSHILSQPSDSYFLNTLMHYGAATLTGTASGASTSFNLQDTSGSTTFTSAMEGAPIVNTTTRAFGYITNVIDGNNVNVSTDLMFASGNGYQVFPTSSTEIEHQEKSKIHKLLVSNLTAPSTIFPVYTVSDYGVTVYPNTLANTGIIIANYIRYPKDPKWTYIGNNFNQSAADYQDFELPESELPVLVHKILEYAGIEIREPAVTQYALGQTTLETKEDR